MAETNIAIRFSVEDEETVRQALERLGKDGQSALDRFNTALDKPGQGLKAIDNVAAGVKERLTGLAVPLGPIGAGLVALGPAGLIAAAGVGAVVAAIGYMTEEAHKMGATAQQLQGLADVTGLTAEQVQTLTIAGARLGITNDQIAAATERFTAQLSNVHEASGPLYELLLRINPQIAQQMVNARSAAAEWDLLAKAYRAAATEAERAELTRLAFGRGGLAMGGLLGATANAGGLGGLQQQNPANATNDEIKRWAQLSGTIAATKKELEEAMAAMWTDDVLSREMRALETLRAIVEQQRQLKEESGGSWWTGFWRQVAEAAAMSEGGMAPMPSTEQQRRENLLRGAKKRLELQFRMLDVSGQSPPPVDMDQFPGYQDPKNKDKDLQKRIAAANQLAAQMQILGTAATSQEQLAAKFAQIDALVAKSGDKYTELGERAKAAALVQQGAADLAILTQNNAATAEQLRAQRIAELNLLVREHRLTQDQATASLAAYEKTIEQTIAQEQVRLAQLPGLKQLELTSGNLRDQLDRTGQSLTGELVSGLSEVPFASDSASMSLKRLEQQLARTALQMALTMTVGRTSASLLQSLMSSIIPGGGSIGSIVDPAMLPGRAAGGPVGAGSWAMVGEAGTELLYAHPGGGVTVFPNLMTRHLLGFEAGGGFDAGGRTIPAPSIPYAMPSVVINNYSGEPATASESKGPNGQPQLEVMVGKAVKQQMGRGVYDNVAAARWGVSRRPLRR
jgi:hypothetical protein